MLTKQFLLSEFFLEPVFTASPYVADNGRPLAELTAAPSVQQGVEFEMRECPYEGSRKGKQMNISALPELSQGFQECVNDTAYLRLEYFKKNGINQFNLYHFWRFTRAMSSMPAFMVRRKDNPIAVDTFPTRIGVLFKASQGLHLAAEVMILNGIELDSPLTSLAIYDYIESHNLFMDGERACAGPKNKVIEFIEAAWEGLHGDASDDWIEHQIGASSNLFDYSDAVSQLFISKAIFEARERLESFQLIRQLSQNEHLDKIRCNFARFGVFAGKDESFLRMFLNSVVELTPELKSSPTEHDAEELTASLQPLFSDLPDEQAKLCIQSVSHDFLRIKHWLHIAEQQQNTVIQHLGYSNVVPEITLTDTTGLGYLPFELGLVAANIKLKSRKGLPTLVTNSGTELAL